MLDLVEIRDSVINGARNEVRDLVEKAVGEGGDAQKILNEGLVAAINVVGDKFEKGEFFLPELVMSAAAMREGLKILRPLLEQGNVKLFKVAVIGTVRGDIHDIGKSIVGIMLEGAGFSVIDLGVDVETDRFIEAIRQNNADLLGMSALLTTTMENMRGVIGALKKAGLNIKTMVGGAPLTEQFANEIGADGYAPNAASAVRKASELVKG